MTSMYDGPEIPVATEYDPAKDARDAEEMTQCGICWRAMTRDQFIDHTHEMDGRWDPR